MRAGSGNSSMHHSMTEVLDGGGYWVSRLGRFTRQYPRTGDLVKPTRQLPNRLRQQDSWNFCLKYNYLSPCRWLPYVPYLPRAYETVFYWFLVLNVIKSQKGAVWDHCHHNVELFSYLPVLTATTSDSLEFPTIPQAVTQNFLQTCRRKCLTKSRCLPCTSLLSIFRAIPSTVHNRMHCSCVHSVTYFRHASVCSDPPQGSLDGTINKKYPQ